MMRTLAVGDIHGCRDKLEDLLIKISPGPEDNFIFMGDYIDRGEDPKGVIDILIELANTNRCVFLRGNHEEMLLDYLEWGRNKDMFLYNGGNTTIASYGQKRDSSPGMLARALPPEHARFFSRLRWYYEDARYLYVHAGIKPGVPLYRQEHSDFVWIRDEFIFAHTGINKKVIFAHTPFAEPMVRPDKIGIDTGAVYGGPLTAIELPGENFIQSHR